ncbi:MAG: MBOAT family protein [Eubacteriales bacterium]
MVFSSTLFIFMFLPLTALVYFVIPYKYLYVKNMVLLAASLLFYSWGEPMVVLLMLLSIAVNYLLGLLVEKDKRKVFLVITVAYNIGILFVFKYLNFTLDNLNMLAGGSIQFTRIALPIGISFYTFQIMSYVIDVYRGAVKAQRNLLYLALYLSFFPQLIAGPIVRYVDVEKAIMKRSFNVEQVASGVRRFTVGFAKKVLISNSVAVIADRVFSSLDVLNSGSAWLGAICYALQIFFDFSGYSDMAIGLGKIFGFEFLENFDYPYTSTSVRDFWRRWHISLSTWFRDYLYIPLGGNRRGAVRTYVNLAIVFAATGLWHGASWTFVVWGVYHGLFLILERAFLGRLLDKIPRLVGRLYSILAVLIGWVIFRADTLSDAGYYIGRMFSFTTGGWSTAFYSIDGTSLIFLLAGLIFSAPVVPWLKGRIRAREERGGGVSAVSRVLDYAGAVGCAALFVLSVVFLTGSDFNPFIYFRF